MCIFAPEIYQKTQKMPNSKNYSIRERIIDKCLQERKGMPLSEIMRLCNKELERRGVIPVSSKQTILTDIEEIENKYSVIIERIRSGRYILYRYKDSTFSIYSSELSEEEYSQLKELMSLLNKFQGMPRFEWLENLSLRMRLDVVCHNNTSVVGFEENPYLKGQEFFSPLFNAIVKHHSIEIVYEKFGSNKQETITVFPYYLKEYNNRWFLLGREEGQERITIYGLERIVSIYSSNVPFIENTQYDFSEYFEDVIGVSFTNRLPEKIILWIDKTQAPYVETKPIHGSQRMMNKDENGITIEIEVIVNYELERLILSYGEHIKVLSPDSLRDKIGQRIRESMKNF